MNVLVVEDSKSIRDLVCAYIQDVGHQTATAENGEDALDAFSVEKVDLVLMDVELPGIDGYETTRRLRARMSGNWIPIIFLSSNYSSGHFVEGINAGGDAYLAKPVNGPVLQAMVKAMGRIAAMRDELHRVNRELEELSVIDPLTSLVNRRGLNMHLSREWGRSNREGSALSLILIDVDHFKKYNDNYGHLEGDNCLEKVSKAMVSVAMRPADVVARYGGEEFVVLLPNTGLDGAAEVAERIRAAVQALALPHAHSSTADCVTVSIGVAEKGEKTYSDDLISEADKALYTAKENGRNGVVLAG